MAQGSPEPDAGIVHLKYGPPRAANISKTTGSGGLALCGKGICFDTGGVNLKPANFMLGMHKDMQGSAVALGTLLALTRLKVPFPIECWLALATNHIGPSAYKPNDVVTAMDGTTIEIVNTDAEGRMVLCDTLTLASRAKPALIIDFATLTGASQARARQQLQRGLYQSPRILRLCSSRPAARAANGSGPSRSIPTTTRRWRARSPISSNAPRTPR